MDILSAAFIKMSIYISPYNPIYKHSGMYILLNQSALKKGAVFDIYKYGVLRQSSAIVSTT